MPEKLLGMEITENAKGEMCVDQKSINGYYTDEGITKEIRKDLEAADNKLHLEGYKLLSKKVIKTGEKQVIRLGAGNGQTVLGLNGKKEGFAPPKEKGGERAPVTTYGTASIAIRKKVPGVIKDSLKDIRAAIEKQCK